MLLTYILNDCEIASRALWDSKEETSIVGVVHRQCNLFNAQPTAFTISVYQWQGCS